MMRIPGTPTACRWCWGSQRGRRREKVLPAVAGTRLYFTPEHGRICYLAACSQERRTAMRMFKLDVPKTIQAIGVLLRATGCDRLEYLSILKLLYIADRE